MAPVFGKIMVMIAQLVGRVGAPAIGVIHGACVFAGTIAAVLKFYRGVLAMYWIVQIQRAPALEAEERSRLAVVRLRLCVGPNGVSGGPDAAIALLLDDGRRQFKLGLAFLAMTLVMSMFLNA